MEPKLKLIVVSLLLCCSIVVAEKGFTSDYFVKKHNLLLPQVNEKQTDISKHAHKSDSWFYFYKDSSDKIDSVYEYLNIEGFPPNKQHQKYEYRKDSIFIRSISIAQDNMDTTSNEIIIFTNNFKNKTYYDKRNQCYTYVTFTSWGQRKSEKNQCPKDVFPHGREFSFVKKANYIESIETYNGEVDSSDIRRYYFTAFDSLCAEYSVTKDTTPFLVKLNVFNSSQQKTYEYGFDPFKYYNHVYSFNYFTYGKNGKMLRDYFFLVKPETEKLKKREFYLVNYTEYTYDSLGRKTSMITRVVPDSVATK
jgi:hypothetical protein